MELYHLITKVSAGAYGQVYKAKHIASLRTVAIKVIRVRDDKEQLKALLRELRILRHLAEDSSNEFTLKLVDAFFHTTHHDQEVRLHVCLVTDYVENSLAEFLDKVGELDTATATKIA